MIDKEVCRSHSLQCHNDRGRLERRMEKQEAGPDVFIYLVLMSPEVIQGKAVYTVTRNKAESTSFRTLRHPRGNGEYPKLVEAVRDTKEINHLQAGR